MNNVYFNTLIKTIFCPEVINSKSPIIRRADLMLASATREVTLANQKYVNKVNARVPRAISQSQMFSSRKT